MALIPAKSCEGNQDSTHYMSYMTKTEQYEKSAKLANDVLPEKIYLTFGFVFQVAKRIFEWQ